MTYCLNKVHCRRSLIASSFEEQWKPEDCNKNCDICQKLCSASRSSDNLGTESDTSYITVDEDIGAHCRLLVEIIEQAQQKQQRLTALKLVDAWRKNTNNISLSLPGETSCDPDTRREEIILHAILAGVLKEEFHFTPYSTISYIGLGRKVTGLKKGIVRVTLQLVTPRTAPTNKKKHISSTSALEQANDKTSRCTGTLCTGDSHYVTVAGPSMKKRALPKMILDTPTDGDDSFKPRTKKRRTKLQQSDKQTGSCQINERTLSMIEQAKPDGETKTGTDTTNAITID